MNFTGIINELKEDPDFESKDACIKIKSKFEIIEAEKQSAFIAENNIDRSISLQEWDLTQKDMYMRLLVDLYSDLIDTMQRKIYTIVGGIESENERKIYEFFIDISNEKLEKILYEQRPGEEYYLYRNPINISEDKYKYYPSLQNAVKFIPELLKKKEFYENQNSAPSKNEKKNKGFRKSSSQKFMKNYISSDTPYNGILIWHEVGVGKTCTAIGIAENFKNMIDSPDKKIIVLTPGKTLTESWYDEIFNIKKELKNSKNNYNQQCTGNNYTRLKIINKRLPEDYMRIKKRRDKIINEYYSILGYRTFVNKFYKDHTKYIARNIDTEEQKYYNKNLIKFIEEKFSNRVFILDEIHYTREDDSSTTKAQEGKKIRKCLELIVRYAKNTKLVLLSATPMYDKASEIIWLINLLRLNDKRFPLKVYNYFENNELIQTEEVRNNFLNSIRGYISYQRGEDPFVFPTKLYPSIHNSDWKNLYIPNNPECLVRSGIYDIDGLEEEKKTVIKEAGGIKYLTLYQSFMDKWQYTHYKKNKEFRSRGYDVKPRQYSNIIYPNISEDGVLLETTWGDGDNHFNKLFIKEGSKYKIHEALIEDNKSILDIDRIGKYSKKIQNILKIINDTDGIIFIYSQFIAYGAQILAFCLEENGFNRFNCNSNGTVLKDQNFIKNPSNPKDPSKNYIFLTGQTRKNILNKLKDYVNSPKNKDGKNIKVIIGTSVVEQGISFFNVRQIHIMDPWYNINSFNQIIGRGVRRYSHHMLEESKRNVTVYLHSAVAPRTISIRKKEKKKQKSLIDEHLYSLSLKKYEEVLEIHRLMKRGSVDCYLNKKGNIFVGLENTHVLSIDARGNDRGQIPLNDLDNSIKCDLRKCEYKCDPPLPYNLPDISTEKDTYSTKVSGEKIVIYIEEIKNIFGTIFAIDFNELKKKLNLKIKVSLGSTEGERENLISEALNTLVQNKVNIYNTITNSYGFLVIKEDEQQNKRYYIFQENENENELIKDKYLVVNNITKDFYIDDIDSVNYKTEPKNKTIDNLIDLLLKSIYNCIIHYWEDAWVMIQSQKVTKKDIYRQFKNATAFATECEDTEFLESLNKKDTQNNGTVKITELKNILEQHGYNIPPEKFNSMSNMHRSNEDANTVNYIALVKNLEKKPCYLNLKGNEAVYHKKDLFKFGINKPSNLEDILRERKSLLFKYTYAFNNFRTTLFESTNYTNKLASDPTTSAESFYHVATIDKPKKETSIDITLDTPLTNHEACVVISPHEHTPECSGRALSLKKESLEASEYDLNRFYDGVYHKNLPNIYDIIYNQFLTYIEDKPLEMRNKDLKNIFKEIQGKPIKDYIDSFFIYKNSDKSYFDQTPYRINFSDINNKELLKLQVIKIIFYSYFSSKNLDIPFVDGADNLKETHPFRKFSYFLTDKMFQMVKSYKIPGTDQEPNYNPKNLIIDGGDKIKYLVIPVSSYQEGKKSKRKSRKGKDGFLLYDIERIEESPNTTFTKDKNYFNSYFPLSDNYLGFYKSKVFGFTLFNNEKKQKKVVSFKSFYVVNSDPAIDSSYEVKYTAAGKISKKSLRRGAACGHGLGVMTKTNLGQLINAMIYKITGKNDKYHKYGDKGKWKQIPYASDLCMELKFILRRLDSMGYVDNSLQPLVPLDPRTRYFYHEHIKTKIDRTIESINL